MLVVISPAKTLDFESSAKWVSETHSPFVSESQELIKLLKRFSVADLQELMGVSESIAKINVERNRNWHWPFGPMARTALQAFRGDVYEGMEAQTFSKSDVEWLNDHLCIISGLYGVLRPLDMMLPYRLEMKTKLPNNQGKDLYSFWGYKITDVLNERLHADGLLLNLASKEYFSAVKTKALKAKVITPEFKDLKNGQYKVISFYAKRARGLMVRFLTQRHIDRPEGLLDFKSEGYRYSRSLSKPDEPVFIRDEIV